MAKMKVYDIAKSINMKSTDLVRALNSNGFEVKSHNSNVEDDAIAFILKNIAPKTVSKQADQELEKPEQKKEEATIQKEKKEARTTSEREQRDNDTNGKKSEVEKVAEASAAAAKGAETSGRSENYSRPTGEKVSKMEEPSLKPEAKALENEKKMGAVSNENRPAAKQNSSEGMRNDTRTEAGGQNRGDSQTEARTESRGDGRPEARTENRGGRPEARTESRAGGRPEGRTENRNGGRPENRSENPSRTDNRTDNRSMNRNSGRTQGQDRNANTANRRPADRNSTNHAEGRTANQGDRGGYNRGPRNDNRTGSAGGPNNRTGNGGMNNRTGGTGGANNRGGMNNRSGDNRGGGNTGNRPYNGGRGGNTSGGNRNFNGGANSQGGRSGQNNGRTTGQNASQRSFGGGGNRGRGDFVDKAMSSMDTPVFETKDVKRKDTKGKRVDKNARTNGKKYRENDITELKPKKDPNRKGAFQKPEPVKPVEEDGDKTIIIPEILTIRELADKMKQPAAAIVKKLFLAGKMYSINQEITYEEAEEIALEYDIVVEQEQKVDVIEELLKEGEEDTALMEKRPPVVCVMGHVDHGKTSLLDAIRETRVTEREAGGITQHIGAYMVEAAGEKITFLDTPGHEAFTSMRMRGAKSTDIAILVVAADDGVMPQTVEAINHAKAAEVEIIVAINKIDKPGANIDRVKQELSEYELIPEDWGGSTIFVPVSAKTKDGIEQLLEMIILTAEILELKANKNRLGRGIVIEAQLDKGRGPVATVLVQKGTLHVGDAIVIGSAHGKIRAMIDDKGRRVKEATPSTPVEILGLNEVPDAGEIFMSMDNEKEAKNVASAYITQGKEKLLADTKAKLSLDGLFSQIQAGNIKELNLIVKADVQGSVEAVKQSLLKLNNEEVAIRIIHGGVGAINESDVSLAIASNAIIIGFNVRPDPAARETAEREKVDVRLYKVIYNAIEDIEAAMKGMLDPVFEEKIIGHAEIRQIFKASKVGNIAGSYVLDGKIIRDSKVRVTREGELVFEGGLASLKRFKDDVKEVSAGYECGLVFEEFDSFKEEDKVEIYIMEEVPR